MHFLVGLDRSSESMDVLSFALRFAAGMDAEVTVAHAVDPQVSELLETTPITTLGDASGRLVIDRLTEAESRAAELLERAQSVASEHDYPITTEILYGDPVPELTTFADDLDADVVFVGHRGRSARMDQIVGSTARGVIERSSVPVLVVR